MFETTHLTRSVTRPTGASPAGSRRAARDTPGVDESDLRALFSSSPVARLATVRPDGAPHVVPVVFSIAGGIIYTAVDHKPKRTQQLQRLENVRRQPRCAVLVDHYDDDWMALWWVRADGRGMVVDEPEPGHRGLRALVERHPQYAARPPAGPLLAIMVDRWSGWSSMAPAQAP